MSSGSSKPEYIRGFVVKLVANGSQVSIESPNGCGILTLNGKSGKILVYVNQLRELIENKGKSFTCVWSPNDKVFEGGSGKK